MQGKETVTNLTKQAEEKEREYAFLLERLFYVQSDQFVEKEARDKLGLVKSGEHIVLLPEAKKSSKTPEYTDIYPNWKRWIELFL